MNTGSVVPETIDVKEDQFHAALKAGLARAEVRVGSRALAYVMDVTTKQLRNIFGGSMPNAKRPWDALAACPTALDNIADLYDRRIVAKSDVTLGEMATVPLAELLVQVAEAESPASEGGPAKTHNELLRMETLIRRVHMLTGGWIQEIDEIRAPRVVAGRDVNG